MDDALRCRVFIGNLPSESVNKDFIKEMFAKYGSYIDCSIYKNFGFVQFNDEGSANKAVEGLQGTVIFDRRLDLKIATKGRKEGMGMNNNYAGKSKHMNNYQRGAYPPHMNHQNMDQPFNYQSQGACQPNAYHYTHGMSDIPPLAPTYVPPPQSNQYSHGSYHPQLEPNPVGQSAASNNYSQGVSSYVNPKGSSPKLCEIICTSRKQRGYAEHVEVTLVRLGFICNINLLGANYSSDLLLNRITNSDVSLAISLKDDNESHRSCNLHLLSGNPEEHRNMPLDVAEQFICKKFYPHVPYSPKVSLSHAQGSSSQMPSAPIHATSGGVPNKGGGYPSSMSLPQAVIPPSTIASSGNSGYSNVNPYANASCYGLYRTALQHGTTGYGQMQPSLYSQVGYPGGYPQVQPSYNAAAGKH